MTPQRFAQRVRAAWRRTFLPALATLACVLVWGANIDHWLPQALRLLRV
jgi:hypothetical protein